MFRKLLTAGAAALAMIAATGGAAQAAMVRVTITEGALEDGGTVTGWFDFDDEIIFSPTAYDLTTTAGSTLAGDHYKAGEAGQAAYDYTLLSVVRTFFFTHEDGSKASGLELFLFDPAGYAYEYRGSCLYDCAPDGERRGEFAYTLSTPPAPAPEPHVWALTLLGFGLAGTALRRRRPSAVVRA